MRSSHTSDGRLIDRYGIPEGARPSTSVTYIDKDGQEYFRANQGEVRSLFAEPLTLASILERLDPIVRDLRVVSGDLENRLRTNPESAPSILREWLTAESLLNEIEDAIGYL